MADYKSCTCGHIMRHDSQYSYAYYGQIQVALHSETCSLGINDYNKPLAAQTTSAVYSINNIVLNDIDKSVPNRSASMEADMVWT